VVVRTRQHLVAIVPRGRAPMLLTLRHRDEQRPPSGLELPPDSPKAAGIGIRELRWPGDRSTT